MTSVPARLLAFAAVLLLAFGGAALAGGVVDPDGAGDDAPAHGAQEEGPAAHGAAAAGDAEEHGAAEDAVHEQTEAATAGAAHGDAHATAPAGDGLPGLAAAAGGLRLVLDDPVRAAAGDVPLRLRVLGRDGRPVRDFAVEHEKRLHLIVVRRDLRGFVHLHPEMAPDGTWSATARLPRAGSYRVLADFRTAAGKRTLGTDLHLAGAFAAEGLPAPATTARTDSGLDVRLRRDGDRFGFAVSRDGRPVDAQLQPYLGAKGHLVTLRAGDLAYLHTHPDGDRLAFEAALPTPGRYRLWVQFRLGDEVHTAAFTVEEPS